MHGLDRVSGENFMLVVPFRNIFTVLEILCGVKYLFYWLTINLTVFDLRNKYLKNVLVYQKMCLLGCFERGRETERAHKLVLNKSCFLLKSHTGDYIQLNDKEKEIIKQASDQRRTSREIYTTSRSRNCVCVKRSKIPAALHAGLSGTFSYL